MSNSWETLRVPPGAIRVGVVITCYNLAEYVGKAIDSVLSQSVRAAEVVVVDDASEDESPAVLAKYAGRVKSVRLASNQGVSIARNLGARSVAGNWLLFLDGDDYLYRDALAVLSKAAAEGGHGVVVGGVRELNPETGICTRRDSPDCAGPPPRASIRGFWRSAIATPGAAIVHRSVHQVIGGFADGYQPREDRDYWLKCGVTASFLYCDQPVVTKLMRAGSISSHPDAILAGMRVQLDFLDWCSTRNIDSRFLEASVAEIIGEAARKAVDRNDEAIVRKIVDYCTERKITGPGLKRYRFHRWIRGLVTRHTGSLSESSRDRAVS